MHKTADEHETTIHIRHIYSFGLEVGKNKISGPNWCEPIKQDLLHAEDEITVKSGELFDNRFPHFSPGPFGSPNCPRPFPVMKRTLT